jgi:FkbM family methyltransferase
LKGILHVGAHECEEIHDYDVYLPRNKVLWVEAIPEKVELCKRTFNDIFIENAVVLDTEENIKFNVSNNYQSSSVLDFGLHSIQHPDIYYTNQIDVKTQLLKNIISKYDSHNIEFNFINLDIQGVELRALKGMEDYLNKVDYVYTEVHSDFVYNNGTLIHELDTYLEKFNLHRVETKWWGNCNWGDAFYIRS